MKKYIEELHSKKIFCLENITPITGNQENAKALLKNYKKQNLIVQIRRNLYSVTDLATKATVANKFEIGSHISDSACISYHSAFEYHGIAHQLFFTLYISSQTRFNNFEFEDMQYLYCKYNISEGIEIPPMNSLIRVTNIERTVIDCLDRIDRAGGLEELIHCLSMINYLDEKKLIIYLNLYNKAFLFKKAGFILKSFQTNMKLSDEFISLCRQNGARHVKYLTNPTESDTFHKNWNIYAPKNILSYLEQGNNELI